MLHISKTLILGGQMEEAAKVKKKKKKRGAKTQFL